MTHPEDIATVERQLAAVESALAGGEAVHEDPVARELQELALQLRADSPQADPAFAEQLRARVEAGFPAPAESARARQDAALERLAASARRAPSRFGKLLLPVAGVGVPLLLIVVVIFAAGGPPGSNGGGGGGGDEAASGGGSEAPSAAALEPPARDGGFVPRQRNRRIERSFTLELGVPLDDMARVADRVTAVTSRHGGFVLSSSVDTGEDGGGGDFSLRIPTGQLRPALRDLAGLAPVIRQSQEGRDVTRDHVTAQDRLRAARAERRSLLRRLEAAATDEEAEAIRRRLELVGGEINGLRSQLRDLRLRTDYAVVTVSLLVDEDGQGGASGGGGPFDDAVDDAGDLLVGFAGVLIRVLALALPLGAIALAAWLAARGVRRRRRESALA